MAYEIQTSGSAARVFDTFELLEHILIDIDTSETSGDLSRHATMINHAEEIRALFRLQRVNTTFRDVIAGSKTLRIIMFKKDINESSAHDDVHGVKATQRHINPLVDHFLSPVIRSDTYFWLADVVEDDTCAMNIYIAAGYPIGVPADSLSWCQLLVMKEGVPRNLDVCIRYDGYEDSTYHVKVKRAATLAEFAVQLLRAVSRYIKSTKPLRDPRG